MIRTPTTLVLGAGASAHLGFPVGKELYEKIAHDLKKGSDTDLIKILLKMGWSDSDLNEFQSTLRYSGMQSVDAFLERRQTFTEIGKDAIAAALIPYERPSQAFTAQHNWYSYLFDKLNTTLDDFQRHNLSIITYNYDRSLEFFLSTALKHSYNIDGADCQATLEQIPIIHVHGTLTSLPTPGDDGSNRPYSTDMNVDLIKAASNSIKIIHESDEEEPIFAKVHSLLESASVICFLGFGYNDVNLRRLKMTKLSERKTIIGSSTGLTDTERSVITGKHPYISLPNLDKDCLDFIRASRNLNFSLSGAEKTPKGVVFP